MEKIFFGVYYIQLTNEEIEKVENENFIDDDEKFETFCIQSKNKKLVALFADKFEAENFSEFITDSFGIARISDPVCIIKEMKIKIYE